jgi:hypothetical protein
MRMKVHQALKDEGKDRLSAKIYKKGEKGEK